MATRLTADTTATEFLGMLARGELDGTVQIDGVGTIIVIRNENEPNGYTLEMLTTER